MNCEQANQIDMVEYLAFLGFNPAKIHQSDYWYLSPNHEERTASFKVNRAKNFWFDHGTGEGGNLVDFAMRHFNCGLAEALTKISSGATQLSNPKNNVAPGSSTESSNPIKIIRVDRLITDFFLLRYLTRRHIDKSIAQDLCNQVLYENAGRRFNAIGFKNHCGGYELRSENFKGSTAPKYVTWFNNQADSITVFEGFFDFLTWRSRNTNQLAKATNVLVLNSLSFFTRSLMLQEKYQRIHLYLDNDAAGKKCLAEVQKRNPRKVVDESKAYKEFKDLNDWHVSIKQASKMMQSKKVGR